MLSLSAGSRVVNRDLHDDHMTEPAESTGGTPPSGSEAPAPQATPGGLGNLFRKGFGGLGDLVVVLVLLSMVVLPVAGALWRRFTGQSIPSATVLVQHLTLWIGFLGALLASRAGKIGRAHV